MTERLLSTQEAAKRAGVTAKTVARWVDSGVLRALFTAGGHRRIADSDLEAFLASRQSLLAADLGSEVVVVLGTARPNTVQSLRIASERARLAARVASADGAFELGLLVGRLVPAAVILDEPGFSATADVVAGLRRLAFPGRIIVLTDRRWTAPAAPDDVLAAADTAGAVAVLHGLLRSR